MKSLRLIQLKTAYIDDLTLRLRKHEKDFLARDLKNEFFYKTGESEYVKKFKNDIGIIFRVIDILKKNPILKNNNLTKEIDHLKDLQKSYEKQFINISKQEFIRGIKNYGYVGKLRTNIHEVTDEIQLRNNKDLLIDLLTLRKHEKNYFIRKTLIYRDKFNQLIVQTKNKLKGNKILTRKLNAYYLSFNKVVDIDIKIGLSSQKGEMGKMRNIIHKAQPLLSKIDSKINNLHNSERKKAIDTMLAVILIELIVSLIVGLLITKDISNALQKVVFALDRIAQRKINFKLIENRKDEIGELYHSTNKIISNFRDIIERIDDSTKAVLEASIHLSASAQQLSQSSNEQSATTEEISTSMEEMLASVSSNNDKAEHTGKIATRSAKEMQESNKILSKTIDTVSKISKKISIITEIAGDTNILSINASIEAAKANEYGKGFAVVAERIGKLADMSKKASNEIEELSSEGQNISAIASEKLKKIIPDIMKSAELINEIISASLQQQEGISAINESVLQLTEITSENSASSQEISTAAEELSAQAEQLKSWVSVFEISHTKEYKMNKALVINSKKEIEKVIEKNKLDFHNDSLDEDFEEF